MLCKYGLDKQSTMSAAQSCEKYWRRSKTQEVRRAITTKQLYKWELMT